MCQKLINSTELTLFSIVFDSNTAVTCHMLLLLQGWISDRGIDGPTFVPKSDYFLLIWVNVCPQKLAFS